MMKHMKLVGGFSLVAIGMTAYIAFMGTSANRATAVAMHDFSQNALNNWHYVSTSLNIPLNQTKPGDLAPVVSEKFGALDLVIYGYEIVSKDFQDYYRQLSMPRMIDQLHIGAGSNGQLRYNVSGVQLLSIQNTDDKSGATFFMDVPFQLIDQSSRMYDGVPATSNKDGEGVVRYDRLDDGRYVMGLFLNYQPQNI
jgi:hypothetical protein